MNLLIVYGPPETNAAFLSPERMADRCRGDEAPIAGPSNTARPYGKRERFNRFRRFDVSDANRSAGATHDDRPARRGDDRAIVW